MIGKEKPTLDQALLSDLRAFQLKDHSLRLSASSIAAMSGFHPFSSLPKLLMELVYQGSLGQKLYRHECQLLGLRITTEEEILLEMATRAGKSTASALQSALNVKTGKQKVETTHGADVIKNKVLEEAKRSKKLTNAELSVLQDGVRNSVNTGYGNAHEDEALNMYESQCGWEVNDRNEQVMAWPFVKAEDVVDSITECMALPTVVPLSPAVPSYRQRSLAVSTSNDRDDTSGKETKSKEPQSKRMKVEEKSGDDTGLKLVVIDEDKNKCNKDLINAAPSPLIDSPKPFFTILGSVDGIREELWCPVPSNSVSQQSPGSDGWTLRQIVVECKHRMKAAKLPPPLYDQIQTTAYCLMYNVTEADLVQVIRKQRQPTDKKVVGNDQKQIEEKPEINPSTPEPKKKGESAGIRKYFSPKSQSKLGTTGNDANAKEHKAKALVDLDKCVDKSSTDGTGNDSSQSDCMSSTRPCMEPITASLETRPATEEGLTVPDSKTEVNTDTDCATKTGANANHHVATPKETKRREKAKKKESTKIDIVVSRVSLDEPIMQHRQNWNNVVLPRLRSFVETVYAVRKSDEKRYQLLIAMSDAANGKEDEAWHILHKECPWLVDCDTAFYRLQQF